MKRKIILALALVLIAAAAVRAEVQVRLPEDELPHPEVPVEWWYYSGHLEDDTGAHYGVMASFFVFSMPGMPHGHFAIYQLVEKDKKKFHRGSVLEKSMIKTIRTMLVGLPEKYQKMLPEGFLDEEEIVKHHRYIEGKPVLKRDELAMKYGDQIFRKTAGAGADWTTWAYESQLKDEAFELKLDMHPVRGPMYVGGEGNVGMYQDEDMFYYSFTRMDAEGTLTVDGAPRNVSGTIWYDHQYGSFGKELRPVGWDWFCVQLENGTDLNLSAMRIPETGERFNHLGTIQYADSTQTVIHDLEIEELGTWTSTDTGFTYPSGWQLSIPSMDMRFRVIPEFPEQEMRTFGPMQAIWEGACTVEGEVAGQAVPGLGYTELVGYNTPKME